MSRYVLLSLFSLLLCHSATVHAQLQSNTSFTFLNVSNCAYLFARSIIVTSQLNGTSTLPGLTGAGAGSYCNVNGNESVVIAEWDLQKTNTFRSISMKMTFKQDLVKNKWWYLVDVKVTVTCINLKKCQELKDSPLDKASFSGVSAPKHFSYHCTQSEQWSNKNVTINFDKIQVQVFGIKAKTPFDRANDCVGFFTIEIFTVLIVTGLLTLMLAFAVSMLMGISTNDRFDNPKNVKLMGSFSSTE